MMPISFILSKLKNLPSLHYDVRKQHGFGLVESLVALAILGSTVYMLVGSLTSGAISVDVIQEDTIAENIGRTQMEYTMSLDYVSAPHFYETTDIDNNEFSVTAEASPVSGRDSNIQKITVTVYRNGRRVYVLEGFKVNR
jgi:prepilin-type N-terminal cleavage/methylation domain-containing protein